MNGFVNAVVSDVTKSKKDARTANGALTRSTSGKTALDLFAIIGAARKAPQDAVSLFSKAYAEDKNLALRVALWARDVRGGAGEREVFRQILKNLETSDPITLQKLVGYVPEFGRVDDVLDTLDVNSKAFEIYAEMVYTAIKQGNGLAAKWCPRKTHVAVKLRSLWNMSPKEYRKFLVHNTNVVETAMCQKDWDNIDFSKLPSLAGLRYQAAFGKHSPVKYANYKNALVKGDAKINVGTLFPHNIITNVRTGNADVVVLAEQWKRLPDYLGENSGKVLVMSDVSGSMGVNIGGSVAAIDVSIALGLYTSERLKGVFKDVVLTFSSQPSFHKVTGNTIVERYRNLNSARWDMSTDLQAAFELVLNTAVKNKVSQEDMPETIVVISDMEFNACTRDITNYGGIKSQYKAAGYNLPRFVFWNVNGRGGNNPVKFDANDTCMISGFSPAILESVLGGNLDDFTPMNVMLETVGKSRYDVVDSILAS